MTKIIVKFVAFVAMIGVATASQSEESIYDRSATHIHNIFAKIARVKESVATFHLELKSETTDQDFKALDDRLESLCSVEHKFFTPKFLVLTHNSASSDQCVKIFENHYKSGNPKNHKAALVLASSLNPSTAWEMWDKISKELEYRAAAAGELGSGELDSSLSEKFLQYRQDYRAALQELLLEVIERLHKIPKVHH